MRRCVALVTSLLCVVGRCAVTERRADAAEGDLYDVGVGRYDITGLVAGVNMMGYAKSDQVTSGIHTRLYARTFLIGDGTNRFAFVNCDMSLPSQAIKTKVVERLRDMFGDTYTASNIVLSATHTHSGPGGYNECALYQFSSRGFIEEDFEAIVEGIVKSISQAHNSLTKGRLYFVSGELHNASINRSPASYANNPAAERARYRHDTDKTMTLLKLVTENGTLLGAINWFAVHPTSMNNTNTLVSGDGKGLAEQLIEQAMDPGSVAGQSSFVGAFAQSNCGDVSPNTDGPKCQDTGEPCDTLTSTCGGRVALCYAAGPGKDMVESTKIIGTKQYEKAMELLKDPSATAVRGPVRVISQHVDMEDYAVLLPNGTVVKTCPAAVGYSTTAGTTDGPGVYDFKQGMTKGTLFWDLVSSLLISPRTPQQIQCHHPKPILLNFANVHFPYDWTPRVVETQVVSVGQFAIVALPGEFTTMAGRRMREKISSVFAAEGHPGTTVVLAGLSNVYTQYVVTLEEYAIQRYEGASTLYGPHTLDAYLQQYAKLASAMLKGEAVAPGPTPPDFLRSQIRLAFKNLFDAPPYGSEFGDTILQPRPVVYPGETVTAKFVSGNPGHAVQLGGSFLTVERLSDGGAWQVVATDADWNTKYMWERTSTLLRSSVSTVAWAVPEDTRPGVYRITHAGYARRFLGDLELYSGVTDTFRVADQADNLLEKDTTDYNSHRNMNIEL